MAMTLVTGLPGAGKTLYTLARWKPEAEAAARPVFHNDIKGLNIPGWQVWDVEKWEQLPAGAILIVDEAQFAFKVVGRGQTPEWVQRLATHRHNGVDIVFITQHPGLLDVFVRKLCDRHFHVMRKWGLQWSTVHEFSTGVNENPHKSRKGSIRHDFKFPREVFTWYKSSELHTMKARIPMRVWIGLAVPFVVLALAYVAFKRVNPDAMRQQAEHAVEASGGTVRGGSGPGGAVRGRAEGPMTVEEYAKAYTARVPGLAHTAPVYDDVTKPVEAPFPAACVSMKGTCRCYSQQATKLAVAADVCEQIVAGGYFVAWNRPVVQAVPIAPAASTPVVIGAGGQVVAAAGGPSTGINGGWPMPFEARRQAEAVANQPIPPDLGAPPRQRPPRGGGT
jgi:zona occludens toxin